MSAVLKASVVGAALDLPASLARIVMMVLDEPVVTSQDVEKKQKFTDGSGRVYMSRLRRVLHEKHKVKLHSSRGSGYYLKPADREKLSKLVERFNK